MTSTNVVDVGTPSSNFDGWTTTEVRFHGFADLSTETGEYTESSTFSSCGHEWHLALCPYDDGYVSVDLWSNSRRGVSVMAQYGFSVRDAAGKEVIHHEPETNEFVNSHDNFGDNWPHPEFATRSEIMDSLVNGSLVIEVRMRLVGSSKLSSQFIPTNPLCNNILKRFNDKESADVVFEVVDNTIGNDQSEDSSTGKRAKTTTTFYAHRLIVQDGSSTLAEMCKPSDGRDSTITVSITDVKPKVFMHMLYYLYGGKLTDEDLKASAKDIINAADKYGIPSLKLEAEAFYVKSTKFCLGNMMDELLYADAMNCALLKEAVMDYIVANKNDIIGNVSFNNFPGQLVTDLLTAMARGEQSEDDDNSNDSINYNKMRVCTLRKMLDENGLDVDGSREAMIALLREYA